jgi:tRNA pseudouridine synthase 10
VLCRSPDEALGRLAALRGPVRQRTPRRVLKRRVNLARVRQVLSVEWRRIDPRTIELALRTSSGLYIKELISGDQDRTRPSVAELLGIPTACAELDVMAIHLA